MIQPERIQFLNAKPIRKGSYVLYWMQASQRARCNHALVHAIRRANDLGQPMVVGFGLTDGYPDANERHYTFMLEGLVETAEALAKRGVQLVVRIGQPAEVCLKLAADASLVVADRGYMRHQRRWRRAVAARAPCSVVQVETDVVVPADEASDKEEYAARTIRGKLTRLWPKYLVPLSETRPRKKSLGMQFGSIRLDDVQGLLGRMRIDRSVRPVGHYHGGAGRARVLLRRFIRDKLARYESDAADPGLDIQSHVSPYLHFGQVSPLEIVLEIRKAAGIPQKARDAYLEQLLVRRELSVNFVLHNHKYDSYQSVPHWARTTLKAHQKDRRPYLYGHDELVACRTHDDCWNAAMREMVITGKMHNYMRMYWAKKIMEWTVSPRAALKLILALNNRFFLDGRDPNSYAGVAWCFGKHDRPWPQRNIFGTVRSMSGRALARKFDMNAYIRRVEHLAAP